MKIIVFSFLCIILLSCSSSDSGNGQNVPAGFVKEIVYSGMGQQITYKYFYEGNKISKITSNYFSDKEFTYTGNLITEIKEFDHDSNLISRKSFNYNSNNDLISSLYLNYFNNQGYKMELIYNNDATVLVSNYSGDLNLQSNLENKVLHYFFNNEIIKTEKIDNNIVISTSNYEYDTYKNPMSRIIGYNKLNILQSFGDNLLPFLFNGTLRNCVKATTKGINNYCPVVKYERNYTSNDYPNWACPNVDYLCTDLPCLQYYYK